MQVMGNSDKLSATLAEDGSVHLGWSGLWRERLQANMSESAQKELYHVKGLKKTKKSLESSINDLDLQLQEYANQRPSSTEAKEFSARKADLKGLRKQLQSDLNNVSEVITTKELQVSALKEGSDIFAGFEVMS